MNKSLHFSFYDMGAYEGETEHRIMCSFYTLRDGKIQIGQSLSVLASEWPEYRSHMEKNGWTYREHSFADRANVDPW